MPAGRRRPRCGRNRAAALEREQNEKAREVNGLRRQAIAAAKKAQRHEAQLIALEERLRELNGREDLLREELTRYQK